MFKRAVIASGPTLEPIDPVRFISNRSSGKTGYHLANEAKKRGVQEIVFVTGPTRYIPGGVEVIGVERAVEMRQKILSYFQGADVVIMAAAVCDYRSARYYPEKLKKGKEKLVLELQRNPDILSELGEKKSENQVLVGFAAETDRIFENAREKFRRKNLDLLVLNRVSPENPAFDEDYNQVYLLTEEGCRELKKMEKSGIAVHIWEKIGELAREKNQNGEG